MPTAKTEATELAVAFGILDLDPANPILHDRLAQQFGDSLTEDKYNRFLGEYSKNPEFYSRFFQVGKHLRAAQPALTHASSVQWTGPHQQAATASFSKDLLVASIPVSVKAESNVVANLSPYNLFISLPSGSVPATHEENWYLRTAPSEFQNLYSFVRNSDSSLSHLPARASDFESQAAGEDRERVQGVIKGLSDSMSRKFRTAYLQMCHEVASISVDIFNKNLARSLRSSSRSAVLENLARWFFRINAVRYILCGIDRGDDFSVMIPDITSFKKDWAIRNIVATPDLSRGQSVVDFSVALEDKRSGDRHSAEFHSEIRWSHGRFCGNPEGKLYKDFAWSSLPIFSPV
jgi:hypothetical protein